MFGSAADTIPGGPADPSPDTRQRVLEAAGQVFAEVGFRAATVRDICAKAGANVAAVNYHFRDKEGLYREVMNYAAEAALKLHTGVPATLGDVSVPADQRLRTFVRGQMRRMLDNQLPAWHSRLVMREMVDPTPELANLVDRFFRPMHDAIGRVVAELLGPAATRERVQMTIRSIVGQTVFYKHCRGAAGLLMPEQGFGPAEIDALAEHIAEFSLGAIAALRAKAEAGGAERKGS